jgi:hypothetical protein
VYSLDYKCPEECRAGPDRFPDSSPILGARARRGELDLVKLDNKTTVTDVEKAPPARACRRLHVVQEKISKAVGIETPNPGALQDALDRLYSQERKGVVRNGRIFPPNSPFTYPEKSERQSISARKRCWGETCRSIDEKFDHTSTLRRR